MRAPRQGVVGGPDDDQNWRDREFIKRFDPLPGIPHIDYLDLGGLDLPSEGRRACYRGESLSFMIGIAP